MQYDLKAMKKEYDSKPIKKCIDLAIKWNQEMIKKGEELVNLLWYLEKTKRFKEIPGYEKMEFSTFVNEICHIPYNRYRELAFAYNWYPEESKVLGPQTIQTIRNKVGVRRIPQVLKEIKLKTDKVESDTYKPGVAAKKKREAITNVLEKYKPKTKPKTVEDTKGYWKKKHDDLLDRYDDLLDRYKALEKELKSANERLEKQSKPLEAYFTIRDAVRLYDMTQ
jgi:hypothetical protein